MRSTTHGTMIKLYLLLSSSFGMKEAGRRPQQMKESILGKKEDNTYLSHPAPLLKDPKSLKIGESSPIHTARSYSTSRPSRSIKKMPESDEDSDRSVFIEGFTQRDAADKITERIPDWVADINKKLEQHQKQVKEQIQDEMAAVSKKLEQQQQYLQIQLDKGFSPSGHKKDIRQAHTLPTVKCKRYTTIPISESPRDETVDEDAPDFARSKTRDAISALKEENIEEQQMYSTSCTFVISEKSAKYLNKNGLKSIPPILRTQVAAADYWSLDKLKKCNGGHYAVPYTLTKSCFGKKKKIDWITACDEATCKKKQIMRILISQEEAIHEHIPCASKEDTIIIIPGAKTGSVAYNSMEKDAIKLRQDCKDYQEKYHAMGHQASFREKFTTKLTAFDIRPPAYTMIEKNTSLTDSISSQKGFLRASSTTFLNK